MAQRYTVAVQMQLIEIDGDGSRSVKHATFALVPPTLSFGHEVFDELHQVVTEYIESEDELKESERRFKA